MASVSSLGAGSGMDLEGLVKGLMKVESLPLDTLKAKVTSFNTKISALGTLSSKLSSLQTAAKALKPNLLQAPLEKFATYSASVGNGDVASATVGAGAKSGSYSLEVTKLAQAQKTSIRIDDPDNVGPLTLDFSGDPTRSPVTITPGSNSLTSLANAINQSDSGVKATIVTANGNKHLVLTGEEGAGKEFSVSGSGVNSSDVTTTQNAQSAEFTFDGVSVTNASNTVTGVLEGVTLNLKAVTTAPTTVTVTAEHGEKLQSSLEAFVKSFNDAVGSIKSLGSYDAETKKTGDLNGNRLLREAQSTLRNLVFEESPDGQTLSKLGISYQKDGTLKLDSDKLASAVANDPEAVAKFASHVGTRFNTEVDKIAGLGGRIQASTDSIKTNVRNLEKQQEALEARLVKIEARYRSQFGALDSLVANMNSTSSYLASQLSSLSK
ncbi:flagellar hook-associated protein 2 [Betaproteobacteria bacterium]|nr:flagellar hook-associated protein 2 [Betaproteobacteria bacterium]GHT98157.1 flagellar hook-associated protein 2 [Betaproteobacteria bacterium]